ncbi:Sec region non-globular protein [Leptospira fletcheri]|uniref:Sec region non-globular protein n=2 Tax=Leptospira fletcheri TaxID=2484981 RepID=A0A4R9GF14_9LEPT|nr:SRP-less Sec system protein [Leptospira fletcheri]TGK10105.1 Sec region non-globular protein [Leptospira fletcheri]
MKKILCLFLSITLTLPAFGQDGEEIDFLDKVSEPKKATAPADKKAQSAKAVKKKKSRKGSKKKKSATEAKENETKKKVEPESAVDPKNESGTGPDGQSKNTEESVDKPVKKEEFGRPQKPYWVNEETALNPKNLPGYSDPSSNASKSENSFQEKLGNILQMGQDKKKEEEKRKAAEHKDQNAIVSFFSEYKKPIIILGLIILFALYRLRAGGPRSISRRSPVTINKVRRD